MPEFADAIVFSSVNEVSHQTVELPPCGPDEIVCETLYTFVSPGTELRVLGGQYSKPKDFPLVPGYSAVARVLEVGTEVSGIRVGDLVSGRNPKAVAGVGAMWGGQASRHVYATRGEDRIVLLPKEADPLDYVVAEVAAISHRGIDAARPRAEETAVVIGQGMIGTFSAAWLLNHGCRVIVCDVDAGRLEKARSRGVAEAVNMMDEDAMGRLEFLLNGGADIVVESSGTSAGIQAAYRLLRKKPQAYGDDYKVEPIGFYGDDWPRLVVQANYIDEVSINPFSFFSGEGVTVLTPSDRGVEDRQKVVEAIRSGHLSGRDFVDLVLPYKEAASGYRKLLEREVSSVAFSWQSEKK
ncbi:zinc-binding dehydrogenase [Puniceicoccus vermicola]|uniref:Zinc-binding dehydrogenase n=1 Tax=Puniceicoccus vermicola TaxID=388746 RepID=A0A7X1AZ99_9BACT|nr:zinc-binding dehydrogenase [Puniceicoccus vermicola]MBC2602701.1 zinc-binding dehydrogenase [Puniceicoccus vermicola]